MDRNPPRGNRAFQERPSRGILLLTSLGIVAFLLLLTYVLRHVPGGMVANPGSSSANCTFFVSPTGKDANSGTSTTSTLDHPLPTARSLFRQQERTPIPAQAPLRQSHSPAPLPSQGPD